MIVYLIVYFPPQFPIVVNQEDQIQ